MAKDPVCGMEVSEQKLANTSTHEGQTYHFCSRECKQRFDQDPQRFAMQLFGIFAALAVILAVVGIYGVMSYSVSRRTHEFGLRLALGAGRDEVLKLVLRQGLKLSLIGVAIGIAGALAMTRLVSGFLYGVKASDPLTFAAVSLLLILVALAASYMPARRATAVDPMAALRYE